MPIPFIVAGLGIAAGVIGIGGHLNAKESNAKAQRVSSKAQELYYNARYSLEKAQSTTEKALFKLGLEKKTVLDSSMRQFLASYDKIKHIQVRESVGINEISKFTIDQQGAIELREMTDIYSSAIKSGATGAVAGAVVALAASGSLTVVTGGLATAGTALMAGEVGAAASITGSALSFGAAMTPLAAVAAPVILLTGISASIKADENLEEAKTMYAEAKAASEKMKISETLCEAIADRSNMFHSLLVDLNKMFAVCSGLLAGVIMKKEGRVFKKKLKSNDFTEDDIKLISVTRSLAGAVKAVIDTPILSKDGKKLYKSESMYDETVEKLPNFSQAVQEIESINYGTKPIEAKPIVETSTSTKKAVSGKTIMSVARKVFAFILGFFVATMFSKVIALKITSGTDTFLFLDSYTANNIAIWLLLFTTVTIIIGKFKDSKVENICALISGISLFVLFVQYCRTVVLMNHYIIFSIIFFIVLSIVRAFFKGKEDEWHCGLFIAAETLCMALWPIGFLIYAFFSEFIGLPSGFCLVVISIIAAFVMIFGMVKIVDEG